jgi:bifunctional NMN adenylyltransferase/nudix hydrolase
VTEPAAPLAVCIARLQPVQLRHVEALRVLSARHPSVLVVCGGVTQPPSIVNPWTLAERRTMLERACAPATAPVLVPVADRWYDDAGWAAGVEAAVTACCAAHGGVPSRVAVYGLEREGPETYARLFPHWEAHPVAAPPFDADLHERLLGTAPRAAFDAVPATLHAWLAESLETPLRQDLREEFRFVQGYRDDWADAPYTPIFVTVDALVTHGEHVLVIRRGRRPGIGLLALPGGFIDAHEFIHDSALRELREETGLALTAADASAVRVFDHPRRSLRGRIVTHLHRYDLPASRPLPVVTAGDDAAHACWLPLADAAPALFFEDHYAMLQVVLGLP